MKRLAGKTAIIAGASRNIGRDIALTFAREGADLVLVARTESADLALAVKACEGCGVRVLTVTADIGDHVQVNRVVETALARMGKVDILVSVAAIRPHKPFWEIDYDEWDNVMKVNLNSTFYFAKALAPQWMARKEPGSIVALGGIASMTAQPNRAHVIASKTGLYGLVRALALELGQFNVRANLVAVGLIDTERRNPEWYPEGNGVPSGIAHKDKPDGSTTGRAEGSPLKRVGQPKEVANVALFLASDESSFVTGDRIVCAGGRYM
jgi:3-oxoacyl-[acyl-carrier protein] reductase